MYFQSFFCKLTKNPKIEYFLNLVHLDCVFFHVPPRSQALLRVRDYQLGDIQPLCIGYALGNGINGYTIGLENITLETSGKDRKLHSKRVGKIENAPSLVFLSSVCCFCSPNTTQPRSEYPTSD